MSYADKLFIDMCKDILENGYSTEGEKVRPKWEDGTYAYTLKRFGVVNRYDLQKEFPALTLRKTFFKSAVDEMLWIWQMKSKSSVSPKSSAARIHFCSVWSTIIGSGSMMNMKSFKSPSQLVLSRVTSSNPRDL